LTLVMDASALTAFVRDEVGADLVDQLIREEDTCVHGVNLCEVYYGFIREHGEERADQVVDDLLGMGIALKDEQDTGLWRQVGRYKAALSISLADCFCLALATRLGAEIVTSDHEFDVVVERGICPVTFIR